MSKEFKDIAKEHNFTETYFPHAHKGPKYIRRIQNFLITSVILVIISYLTKWGASFINPKPLPPKEAAEAHAQDIYTVLQAKVIGFFESFTKLMGTREGERYSVGDTVLLMCKSVLRFFANLELVIAVLLVVAAIVLVFVYIGNVIKRQREFERHVIRNDFTAVSLYRGLMRSLRVNKYLSEAKRAAKPKGGKGSSYEPPSADAISKVDELKALKKMFVQVNTRQKLGADTISTTYLIFIDLPPNDATVVNLLKRLDTLDETTTRVAKGAVVMGKYMLTDDRQQAIFRGETPEVADPYNFTDKLKVVEASKKEEEASESSYSLDNFISKLAEIEEKKEAAQGWATRQGKLLDSYLITGKMNVTRYRTLVSSTKATFTYDLAHDSSLSNNTAKLDESLDKTFGLRGATSRVEEGKLVVVFPMPKQYAIPIDVPSLYKTAFG